MIRGFIGEFVRQSQQGIIPCNIASGRNTQAAALWAEQTPQAFHEAAIPGLFHAASSYRVIKKHAALKNDSPAFHALGHILKTSIETFNEEYPHIDADHPPQASVYNDVTKLLRLSATLDRLGRGRH